MRSLMQALLFSASLTLGPFASAQEMPPPPAIATDYAQCDDWRVAFKAHAARLSAIALACSRQITVEDTRDQVPLVCGYGTSARRCAAERDAHSCAYRDAGNVYADCRYRVRAFLEGKEAASSGFEGDWWENDLRDSLIGAYRDKLPSASDAVDFAGKSFLGKVAILKQVLDARANPTPQSTLSAGQAFASQIFSDSGASALASTLFDASSAGVAAAGADAIDQMTASLMAFDSDLANRAQDRAAQGIAFLELHAPPPTPQSTRKQPGSGQGARAKSCITVGGEAAYWCLGSNGQPARNLGLVGLGIGGTDLCSYGHVRACE